LLCSGVFFVADEGELRVVFVPGQALILAFAAQQSDRVGVGVCCDSVDAVGVVCMGRGGEDECFGVFADREVECVAEFALGGRGRVKQDQICAVLFFVPRAT